MRAIILSLAILLLATAAVATVVSEPVRIDSFRVADEVQAGEFIPVYVHISAEEGSDVENLKIRAIVMDGSGYYSDGRFDLDNSRSSRFDLMTEPDSEGWALVRVVVSNDDIKRVKHRWVKIN